MQQAADYWRGIFSQPETEKQYKRFIEQADRDLHAFLTVNLQPAADGAAPDPAVAGLPFGVKDNIAVQGMPLSCGSRIQNGFVSPYTATAVQRLVDRGARVAGKTNLDEFGMGSSTGNSAFGPTANPWDRTRVPGGSSGGSAAAVAAGMVPFALGSDTGGSIRQPASFCGVYGLKPTYGAVSRYGLVAYASSLEVIGVAARSAQLLEDVFAIIRGQDEADHSSLAYPEPHQLEEKEVKRIGVLGGQLGLEPAVAEGYRKTTQALQEAGYQIVEVELPTMEYVAAVYYTIATAEASANLARFNGVRYGSRPDYAENPEELMRTARDQGFGDEVKLRVLLGTYVLRSGFQDQYYLRAQRIRSAIRNDFARVFTGADLLLMPVFPVAPFLQGEGGLDPFQQKIADRFTSAANLAGIPALAFPSGVEDGLPVGMQLLAPAFREDLLFQVTRRWEEEHPVARPPDYPGFPAWLEKAGKGA